MAANSLTVALAGNPNCGKTTIFNNITGARQHVGNYPGVTVEKREGFRRYKDTDMMVVDLPGTYSLTANALDELAARSVIINDKPDIIANILDASNLERNLYLAVQLLELERPMVLALNMVDVAEKTGHKIDYQILQAKLGVPVVTMIGNRNRGTEELLQTVMDAAGQRTPQTFSLDYGPEIEAKIQEVAALLTAFAAVKYPLRWLAIKLLEDDQEVINSLKLMQGGAAVLAMAEKARAELKTVFGEDLELVVAECRYHFAGEVYQQALTSVQDGVQTTSDKIDSILTHRIIGLPIFFGIMWLLFNFVFTLGHYPQDWLEEGVKWLGAFVGQNMADSQLKALVTDGIIGGVGTVISFLPQILLLFFGIALLEDTGYMARAAFIMDRVMRAVGLHGKSFIPMLLGFGCNVPAIMGTRTLDNPRDRMVTILVSPLMSCSARLPVYTLLISAFFSEQMAGSIMFSLYFTGIMLAVIMAFLFRKFLFPGTTEAFVMEMPPYHLPTLRSIVTHMWERSVLYMKKAGTLILAASILVWFATNYPHEVSYSRGATGINVTTQEDAASQNLSHSYAGRLGQFIEPVIRPLGFDWKMGVGLVSAVAAKEVLVSTLGTIYSAGNVEEDTTGLQNALSADPAFNPLVAYTLMIFTLIYSPCLAALAVIRRETNSWRWPLFSFTYSTLLAWLFAFAVYHIGMFLGY